MPNVTVILNAIENGSARSEDLLPLVYDELRHLAAGQMKNERPGLRIVINGGIPGLDDCEAHLSKVDGVMLGREVARNPYLLAGVDGALFADARPVPSRHEVARRMLERALAPALARVRAPQEAEAPADEAPREALIS